MSLPADRPCPSEPEILAFQARCDAFHPPGAAGASVAEQRRSYDALCRALAAPRPAGLLARDAVTAGVATRRYTPAEHDAAASVLFLHGGGFALGSLESHDSICADLACALKAEVVAVDYRLAPEHPFPAAFDDGFAVLGAMIDEGRRVVLAGDSAGGTLAAGLCGRAREAGFSGIVGQALIYPDLGGDLASCSYREMAEAPGLSTADVRRYRARLGAPPGDRVAHPLRAASLAGLPPAYVTAARFDPLRDDARAYAARLAGEGVDVTFREEPQMVHAWLRARTMSPGARAGFAALCAGIAALCRLA